MIHDWAGPTGELWCPNCRARSDVPRDVMDGNRRRELLAVAAQVLPAVLAAVPERLGRMLSESWTDYGRAGLVQAVAFVAVEIAHAVVTQVGEVGSPLPQYPEPKDSSCEKGGEAR